MYPYRRLFGFHALYAVLKVFARAFIIKKDFGFQEYFEEKMCVKFASLHSKKKAYVDGVSSGTAAVYLALKALDIGKDYTVIVSPITNPALLCQFFLLDVILLSQIVKLTAKFKYR